MPLGFVMPETTDPGPRRPSAAMYTERRRSFATTSLVESKAVQPPPPTHSRTDHILAFLDCNFWVCLYNLSEDAENAKVKRHCFLPRDWLRVGWLDMAVMRPDGALLWPKNGEVAVVMHELKQEWVD